MNTVVPRFAALRLKVLADGLRIVIVNGPRQAGKSTLLRQFQQEHGGTIRSLDEPDDLDAALRDPSQFATFGEPPRLIDEVQRSGDRLVLAIKVVVDNDNARGQFILSGSARFLTVPTLSESLAGRMGFVELWPFATAERVGVPDDMGTTLVDAPTDLLGAGASPWTRDDYLDLACLGGFPEIVDTHAGAVRRAWFEGYLDTVIRRDISQFADVHHVVVMRQLLDLLAVRTGSPVVRSDLASTVGLSQATVGNYLSYLDTVFLTLSVPAWSTNLTTKAAKSSRSYLSDSGLAAHLMDLDADAIRRPIHPALGPLIETLAVTELTKLLSQSDRGISLRYFRDRAGREIDLILLARDGRVTGIEVKATSSPSASDFHNLTWLRDKLGDRFTGGIVLHLGARTNSFGDRLISAPLSALWHHATL